MNRELNSRAYIAGVGMVTPLGVNTEMTAAAFKAGISSYNEVDFFDNDFNKIKMCCVPQELLDDSLVESKIKGEMSSREARMLQLTKLALLQLTALPKNTKIPLFLACPEQVVAEDPAITMAFIQNLAIQSCVDLDIENCRIISMGRAGGLDAINLAIRFLDASSVDYILVGGVDTFYDKPVIDYYLKDDRLLVVNSMDGFVPGEAAAFLLLSKTNHQGKIHALPYIFEPGIESEPGHMYSDQPYTGSGLAAAVTRTIKQSEVSKINAIYSSMNGEHFFAKELGVMIIRNNSFIDEAYDLLHPADSFGDLGAAIGIVMMGMVHDSLLKRQIDSPCLVCCSSDSALRSAAIVCI